MSGHTNQVFVQNGIKLHLSKNVFSEIPVDLMKVIDMTFGRMTKIENDLKKIEDTSILNLLVQMNADTVQAMYTVKENKCIENLIVDFNEKLFCVGEGETMKDSYRNLCKYGEKFSDDFFEHANIEFR